MILMSNKELEVYFNILDTYFEKYEGSDKELEELEKENDRT